MLYLHSTAEFSPCEKYRYHLMRVWKRKGKLAAFIGLNPSTATAEVDDPTIRRCVAYARREGFSGMHMLNIFAYRSTDPEAMKKIADPVGEDNDKWIAAICCDAPLVVACWGGHGLHRERGSNVRLAVGMLRVRLGQPALKCFGLTMSGQPKHPLYLKNDASLISL